MTTLAHAHLADLTLEVDFAAVLPIGPVPAGRRSIALITGGHFAGARLNGTVLPGGRDWVVHRADGVMVIDVRLTLKTDDDALIYLTYQGRFLADREAMRRFGKGEQLAPQEYSLAIVARFECAAPQYAWLNDAIVVGTGAQTPSGPVYSLFTIG